jgi:peroxiredoxin
MKDKLLIAAILILCVETIFLTVANRNLNRELKRYRLLFYQGQVNEEAASFGTHLDPGIAVRGMEKRERKRLLDLTGGRGALLFVLSTDCFSCDQASGMWNKLFSQYRDKLTILGISKNSKSDTGDYIRRNKIPFPVYLLEDSPGEGSFTSTPYTLLIDGTGGILKSKVGILEENDYIKLQEMIK